MLHNRRARLKFSGFWLIDKAFSGPPPGAAKQDVDRVCRLAKPKFLGLPADFPRIVMTLS